MNRFLQAAYKGQEKWCNPSSHMQHKNSGAEIKDFPSDRTNKLPVSLGLSAKVIDLTSYRANQRLTFSRHQ